MKELTCVIQARISGNQRCPGKMIRPFAGSCLVKILLEKLLQCKNLDRDRIYLSACEEELMEMARDLGIKIYNRPDKSISENKDNKANPLIHLRNVYSWAYVIDSEYFIMISACNPLLSVETIDKAIGFFQDNNIDSLFSVIKRKNYYFDKDSHVLSKYSGNREEKEYFYHLGTQWLEPVYEAAHSIYIFNTAYFKEHNMHRWSFTKDDPYLFEIPPEEAFDIDYPWQFALAEEAYIQRYGRKR